MSKELICVTDCFFKGKLFHVGERVAFDPGVKPPRHFVDPASIEPDDLPVTEGPQQHKPMVIIAGDINKLPSGELRKIAMAMELPVGPTDQKKDLVEMINEARAEEIKDREAAAGDVAETTDGKDLFNDDKNAQGGGE